MFADEGVYVNTNGELVRHAMLQWGETPYAIGKLSCKLMIRANIFRILLSRIIDFLLLSILFSQCRSCDNTRESIFFDSWTFSCWLAVFLMNMTKVPTSKISSHDLYSEKRKSTSEKGLLVHLRRRDKARQKSCRLDLLLIG